MYRMGRIGKSCHRGSESTEGFLRIMIYRIRNYRKSSSIFLIKRQRVARISSLYKAARFA